jgi:hypothetical protein
LHLLRTQFVDLLVEYLDLERRNPRASRMTVRAMMNVYDPMTLAWA